MNRNQKIVTAIGGGLFVLAAAANLTTTSSSSAPSPPRRADVLLMRDFGELRFTNDSAIDLHNCGVELEGEMYATLDELPARGRGAIARDAFGKDLPRDEFFRRSRRITMNCLDDANAFVEIILK